MNNKLRIRKGEDFSSLFVPEKVSENVLRYGLWEFKRRGNGSLYELTGLSRSGVLEFLNKSGYYRLAPDSIVVVREQKGVIEIVGTENIKAHILDYLEHIEKAGVTFKYKGRIVSASKLALKETYFKQQHLVINHSNLEHLKPLPSEVLSDDAHTAFFPYKDGIAKVTATGITVIGYDDLDGKCVWKRHVIDRETPPIHSIQEAECKFDDFIWLVSGSDAERRTGFRTAIGYLLHNHTKPSKARAVLLYDERRGNGTAPNGGTGKGIIANAIGQIRVVTRIDGKRYRSDNPFKFQLVSLDSQIVWIDDPKPDFPFTDLFSDISEGMTFEKKNQTAFTINVEKSPKFLLCSNSILSSKGTSDTRRQQVLELDDHYMKLMEKGHREPIVTQHGGRFFDKDDWDKDEWARFDLYMLLCVREYLTQGLIPFETVNVAVNKLIQESGAAFVNWVEEQSLVCNVRYDTKTLFTEFKALYRPDDKAFIQKEFTEWMKLWAEFKGWHYELKPSNGKSKFILTVAKCD